MGFRADVKNNVVNILRELSRLRQADGYLTEARRLAVLVRDKVKIAQIDDSRARVFIAQKRFGLAETASRDAVTVLQKGGHQSLLADALITHGTALARLDKTERSRFIFQKAIEAAYGAGALNKAGLAALTLIEEVDQLSPEVLAGAYEQAGEWLADCQSQELWQRFKAAGKKLALRFLTESKTEDTTALFNKPCDMPDEVLKFERGMISQALARVNGSVTHAAAMLGIGRQRLAYIIETRHKDLLEHRTPVRRRPRKYR